MLFFEKKLIFWRGHSQPKVGIPADIDLEGVEVCVHRKSPSILLPDKSLPKLQVDNLAASQNHDSKTTEYSEIIPN